MDKNTIPAGRFKQGCLALLEDVAANKSEFIITKRGKPMARLVPLEAPEAREAQLLSSWRGRAQQMVDDKEIMRPSGDLARWKVSRIKR